MARRVSAALRKSEAVPDKTCTTVEESWHLIHDKDKVGQEFLLRIFDEVPDALDMFPFGKHRNGNNPSERAFKAAIRAHGRYVMDAVGECVAGLKRIDQISPTLLSLGEFHRRKGVQGVHFDLFFKHLIGAIEDEIGPDRWTEDMKEAWFLAALSIKSVMTTPDASWHRDALDGWSQVMAVVCAYEVLVEPLRLAGFVSRQYNFFLYLMDIFVALCFATDLYASSFSYRRRWGLKFESDGLWGKIEQWKTTPSIDVIMLTTTPLLVDLMRFLFLRNQCTSLTTDSIIGMSWVRFLGIFRIFAMRRLLRAFDFIESQLLVYKRIDSEKRSYLQISKLLAVLAYGTHLFACLWCAIERIELGLLVSAEDGFERSPFFPDPDILLGNTTNEIINGYMRAHHWAWVNLAGIGNHESVPKTSVECLFVMIVHFFGATLYALFTGELVSFLQNAASAENEALSDLAALTDYMKSTQMPKESQDRIVAGFIMSDLVTQENSASGADSGEKGPKFPEKVAKQLPTHLQKDLIQYARVEALRRRNLFQACSLEFRLALMGSLKNTITMLPGDYLIKEGEESPKQVYFIEKGMMSVMVGGKSIKILRRGDVIGTSWLLSEPQSNDRSGGVDGPLPSKGEVSFNIGDDVFSSRVSTPSDSLFSEISCFGGPVAGASVRALERCTIASGLSNNIEVIFLRTKFPYDFVKLDDDLDTFDLSRGNWEKGMSLVHAAAAAKRIKNRLKAKE